MDSIELLNRSGKSNEPAPMDLRKNEEIFCLRLLHHRWTSLIRPKVTVVLFKASHESHKVNELILNYKTENYGAEVLAFANGTRAIPLKHFFFWKLLLSLLQLFSMTVIQEPVLLMKLDYEDDLAVAMVNGLFPTLFGAVFGAISIILACFVDVSLGMVIPIILFGCKIIFDTYILHELICGCPINALFSVDTSVTYELTKFRSVNKNNILENIAYKV